MRKLLFLLIPLMLVSCRGKVNPNEWVVYTTSCWNNIKVAKAGKPIPRLYTPCDRMVILPATYLAADFVTETKFADRLAGTVALTYQWRISKPEDFVKSAKTLTSTSSTSGSAKADPDQIEEVENTVVDKMLSDVIREYTPNIQAGNIDELVIERELQQRADSSLADRGVQFANLSVNVTLSPQAEEALDVISALNFYRANGEEELGRKIIEAKAGATNIAITK